MLKVRMTFQTNVAERVLTSAELVEATVQVQCEEIGRLLVQPELAIFTTLGNDAAIQTYFRSKSRHAERVGFGFTTVPCEGEDALLAAIQSHNEDELTHGMVVQLPLRDKTRAQELCDSVVAPKDVDALSRSGQEFFDPPTALATVELARFHTDGFAGIAPHRVAVVGAFGRLIGVGAVNLLRNEGFDPILIDLANKDDVHTLGRDVDLIITGTGQPGSITPRDLERPAENDMPLVIIDGGIGLNGEGMPAQDLHPDVFDLPYVRATKRTKAVGPLAVALMFGNVLEAAKQQTLDN